MEVEKQPHETFSVYAARVNKLADEFKFNELTFEQLKCLIYIVGLRKSSDVDIKTKLLMMLENDPTKATIQSFLEECNKIICIKQDANTTHQSPQSSSVKKIKQKGKARKKQQIPKRISKDGRDRQEEGPKSPCWFCGTMHFVKDCDFKDHKCRDCHQVGHKEGYCAAAKRRAQKSSPKIKADTKSISVQSVHTNRKYILATINNVQVKLQLDTASDLTLISERTWHQINQPALEECDLDATDANGNQISIMGTFRAAVRINQKTKQARIAVTKKSLNLLGLDILHQFDLLDQPINKLCLAVETLPSSEEIKKQLKDHCPEIFEQKLGKCKNPVKVFVSPQAKPIFIPARNVAFALRDKVEDELDRLQAEGIITPTNFSNWAAPIVVVKKASG